MTRKQLGTICSTGTMLRSSRTEGARSTAPLAILILIAVSLLNLFAADPVSTLPANADAAWKEIQNASRPPVPPAEWAGKTPTPEQREAFNKALGEKSLLVAAKAKEFYTRFPAHPK